jgi:hypothetical protein
MGPTFVCSLQERVCVRVLFVCARACVCVCLSVSVSLCLWLCLCLCLCLNFFVTGFVEVEKLAGFGVHDADMIEFKARQYLVLSQDRDPFSTRIHSQVPCLCPRPSPHPLPLSCASEALSSR